MKDIQTVEFHEGTWNGCVLSGFFLTDCAWNIVWILDLEWYYTTIGKKVGVPSARLLSNFHHREYTLPVDVIKKPLLGRDMVSVALDWSTPVNKLGIKFATAYYVDRNWRLQVVQTTLDEVGTQLILSSVRVLWTLRQGLTYCSNIRHEFEKCSELL